MNLYSPLNGAIKKLLEEIEGGGEHDHDADYEPLKGADDNYVTDAEKTVIGNTSGINTGDETQATIKTKLQPATTLQDGYLTKEDWTAFDGKEDSFVKNTAFNKNFGTNAGDVLEGNQTFSANRITSDVFDIARIPLGAVSTLVTVADETARFLLTTNEVQNGDTVKQTDIDKLFYVSDDTNLNNASGYADYNASTDWSLVTSKPQNIVDIAGITASDDDIIQKKAGAFVNRTVAQFRTDLDPTEIKISSNDTTPSTLDSKVITGQGIDKTIIDPSTNEKLELKLNQVYQSLPITGINEGIVMEAGTNANTVKMSVGTATFINSTTPVGQTSQINVSFAGLDNIVLTDLATASQTYIGVTNTGTVFQTSTKPDSITFEQYAMAGVVMHPNGTVTSIVNSPSINYNRLKATQDWLNTMGTFVKGGTLTYKPESLKIIIQESVVFQTAVNYENDVKDPNSKTIPIFNGDFFSYRLLDGSNLPDTDEIDATIYESSAGVTSTVPLNTDYTIQKVYRFAHSEEVMLQLGQKVYSTKDEALQGLYIKETEVEEYILKNAYYVGSIILKKNVSDLTGTNTLFIPATALGEEGAYNIPVDNIENAITSGVMDKGASQDTIFDALALINTDIANNTTILQAFNGSTVHGVAIAISSDGVTITASVNSQVGTDIIFILSSELITVDVTTPKTVSLTAGTDPVEQTNYLYFLQSDPTTLVTSTIGYPLVEHAPIGIIIVQSAIAVQNGTGVLEQHNHTDHSIGSNSQGHISHLNAWVRRQKATWKSGVLPTFTGSGTGTINLGTDIGEVWQLHPQIFPAITSPANVYVVNDATTPNKIVTNLGAGITEDSTGATISNNKWYALIIFGVASETGSGESKLFVNIPSGTYNSADEARNDIDNYGNFGIPDSFKGTGFLITKLIIKKLATTWELDLNSKDDLRSGSGSITGTGTGQILDNSITDAKLADVPTNTVKARTGVGTGDPENLAIDGAFKAALNLVKADVGLGNVDNTSDANKIINNEFADLASFPATGITGRIYTAQDTNLIYRWEGAVYTELSVSTGSSITAGDGIDITNDIISADLNISYSGDLIITGHGATQYNQTYTLSSKVGVFDYIDAVQRQYRFDTGEYGIYKYQVSASVWYVACYNSNIVNSWEFSEVTTDPDLFLNNSFYNISNASPFESDSKTVNAYFAPSYDNVKVSYSVLVEYPYLEIKNGKLQVPVKKDMTSNSPYHFVPQDIIQTFLEGMNKKLIKTATFEAENNGSYFIDTTLGAITITIDTTKVNGFIIQDFATTWTDTNKVIFVVGVDSIEFKLINQGEKYNIVKFGNTYRIYSQSGNITIGNIT